MNRIVHATLNSTPPRTYVLIASLFLLLMLCFAGPAAAQIVREEPAVYTLNVGHSAMVVIYAPVTPPAGETVTSWHLRWQGGDWYRIDGTVREMLFTGLSPNTNYQFESFLGYSGGTSGTVAGFVGTDETAPNLTIDAKANSIKVTWPAFEGAPVRNYNVQIWDGTQQVAGVSVGAWERSITVRNRESYEAENYETLYSDHPIRANRNYRVEVHTEIPCGVNQGGSNLTCRDTLTQNVRSSGQRVHVPRPTAVPGLKNFTVRRTTVVTKAPNLNNGQHQWSFDLAWNSAGPVEFYTVAIYDKYQYDRASGEEKRWYPTWYSEVYGGGTSVSGVEVNFDRGDWLGNADEALDQIVEVCAIPVYEVWDANPTKDYFGSDRHCDTLRVR